MSAHRETVCAAAGVVLLTAILAYGDDTSWQHPATGNWFTPTNWTAGVPTGDDRAYIGSEGTATIGAGTATAHYVYIGDGDPGTVDQAGGTASIGNDLYIGHTAGGTYRLAPDAHLQVTGTIYMDPSAGYGRLEWLGGTVAASEVALDYGNTLALGYDFNVADLTSGDLLSGGGTISGLHKGNTEVTNGATATQDSGGAVFGNVRIGTATGAGTYAFSAETLSTVECTLGNGCTGTFSHSNGTHTNDETIHLGLDPDGEGSYVLSAAGSVLSERVYVGYEGTGRFDQQGGTHTVGDRLSTGERQGSVGTYELHAGNLHAHNDEYLGRYGQGRFVHTGGTHTITKDLWYVDKGLRIGAEAGSDGRYELSGTGHLTCFNIFVGQAGTGAFVQSGGVCQATFSLDVGNNGTYDLSAGDLETDQFYVNGTFRQSGGTHQAHTTRIRGRYELSGTGQLSGGHQGNGELINGTGQFLQTGGSNDAGYGCYVGTESGDDATYILSGGDLTAENLRIGGTDGTGTFVQTGGTNYVHGLGTLNDGPYEGFFVGGPESSNGLYELGDTGELTVHWAYIGDEGTGRFVQSGGVFNVDVWGTTWPNTAGGELDLGYENGSEGTYELSAGTLNVNRINVGESGSGVFTQTGGTHNVAATLRLAANSSAEGTYAISGGILTAGRLEVGYDGSATLTITDGGTVNTDDGHIGSRSGSVGTARVEGHGSTWTNAGDLYVGRSGSGTLSIVHGGRVNVADTLTIDHDENGDGVINMSTGGALALFGDAAASLPHFLSLVNGSDAIRIRYWDDDGLVWDDIANATMGEDYGLTYLTEGDLAGYTELTASDLTLAWQGGATHWSDSNWTNGANPDLAPETEIHMVVDADTDDSDVTVTTDFDSAYSLRVGENHSSTVTVDAGSTLTVDSAVSVGADGTLRLNASGTLNAATVESCGTLEVNGVLNADTLAWSGTLTVGEDGVVEVTGLFGDAGEACNFTKDGEGLLIIGGVQDHAEGAYFDILGGTVEMCTDASGTGLVDDADLSICVTGATLNVACDQHLDTLEIGDGGLVQFTGAEVVVVKHLIMNGTDLGATTLTPEPATLALLAVGGFGLLARRKRRG